MRLAAAEPTWGGFQGGIDEVDPEVITQIGMWVLRRMQADLVHLRPPRVVAELVQSHGGPGPPRPLTHEKRQNVMSTTAVRPDISIDFGSIKLAGVLVHDDDQRSLVLHTDEGPEFISVNLSAYGVHPAPGQIFIKDWSEHSRLAKRMQEQGLVTIVDSVRVGPFCSRAHLVEVTVR